MQKAAGINNTSFQVLASIIKIIIDECILVVVSFIQITSSLMPHYTYAMLAATRNADLKHVCGCAGVCAGLCALRFGRPNELRFFVISI